MNRQEYINRRQRLFEMLPEQSMSFFFAGVPIRKSADTDYPFFVNRNFYYLTGILEQEAILVLVKTRKATREYLFIREINPLMEKWVGHYIRPSEATAASGIHMISFLGEFKAFLQRNISFMNINTLGIDNDPSQLQSTLMEADQFSLHLQQNYSGYPLFNTFPFLSSLRSVKSEAETEAIEKGCELTFAAIKELVSHIRVNGNERDLAAAFHYCLERNGGRPTFDTIIAGGENACVLHYVDNSSPLNDNELVLIDLGGALSEYGADISQTFPINGSFTPRQKAVYEVVLDCYKQIIAATKPGVTMGELNALANDVLGEGCVKLGLIDDKSKVREYYFHSIGHSLGLDTHDVGFNEDTVLAPGHVITDEPGLYIAEEKIGIRIETNLLVTETGSRDLAPFIPREVADVEALVKGK